LAQSFGHSEHRLSFVLGLWLIRSSLISSIRI
jgi:hypothetical protein